MNSYVESIRFLYGLQKFGMKFGLQGIKDLTSFLGNPHLRYPCVHIAGTNGKGSTASMIAAVLTAAGYKTGLYTSPHLVDFRERIRVNGKPIPPKEVVRLCSLVKKRVEKHANTFFETTTAMAFQYFAESRVDIAVIETGLGGRLDATNIVHPAATVITGIGMEHTELLGKTLVTIAKEKAGILKEGIACVSGAESREAVKVLRRVCARMNAPYISSRAVRTGIKRLTLKGVQMDVTYRGHEFRNLTVSLPGSIQAKNAALALLALENLRSACSLLITDRHIRSGLSHVQSFSGIRGRLSVLRKRPLILADTAHNPQAIEVLVKALVEVGIRKADVVFGVMKEKDYISMVRSLARVTNNAFTVTARTARARDGRELERKFRQRGVASTFAGGVGQGLKAALESARRSVPIVITGSNFVVGEAVAHLEGRKYLTINQ